MLGKTRTGLTFWTGVGTALVAAGLVGCGGHSSKKKSATTSGAATTTSSTTGGTTSGSTGGGGVITPGGGTIGGLPGGGIPGGGGFPGGGIPGGGGTPGGLPGGGLPGGGTPGGGGGGGGGTPDDHGNNAASATALAANTGVAGIIGAAGDTDWFKVQLNAGVNYSFLVGTLGNGMDSVVTLVATDGTTVIGENDNVNAQDPSSRFDAPATPAAGQYYVVVKHAANGTGSYEVRYTLTAALPPPPRPDDHGDDAATATQATLGTAVRGEMSKAGDVDFFKIDLVAGQTYEFLTQNLTPGAISGPMDTYLYLLDTNGTTILFANDDTQVAGATQPLSSRVPGPAAQGFPCTVAGTYYLVVEHFDPNAEDGGYEVLGRQFAAPPPPPPPPPDDHGNTPATATVIGLSAVTAGRFETATDVDYFKVDLVAGQRYEFKTQNPNPGGLAGGVDTTLELLASDGTTRLGYNDDRPLPVTTPATPRTDWCSRVPGPPGANTTINDFFTAPTTGSYYLKVAKFGAVLGTYEVVALQQGGTPTPADDHGNSIAAATTISIGTPMAGRLEVGNDVDYFKVDLAAGTNYELKTITNGDTLLRLYSAQGQVLGENDDEAPGVKSSKLTHMPAAAGSYYLAVTSPITTATTYQISVTLGTPPPPPPAASLASAMLNDVDASGDASMGDTIKLTFSSAVTIMNPPATIDPASELDLLVQGNSFGTGATLVLGPAATEVTITLGQGPVLRLTGAFNPAALTIHSPSGLAMKATTAISTVTGGLAATGMVDVDSSLTAGFRAGPGLVQTRAMAAAVVLNDGRVLVTGGMGDGGVVRNSSELLDAGQWSRVDAVSGNPGGYMVGPAPAAGAPLAAVARYNHTATKLPSGKVLIAGGSGYERFNPPAAGGQPTPVWAELASAHLFDPANNTFARTGNLNVARGDHYATLLPNGQVLIAGGYNRAAFNGQGASIPAAELYDETTGTFTMMSANGADMVFPRQAGSADLVGNKVIYVGGQATVMPQGGTQVQLGMAPGTEAYDMAANDFVAGPAMSSARRWQGSVVLPTGELLVVGGDTGQAMSGKVEKYDPATNMFSPVGDLTAIRARHKAVLVNGNLLVVGGINLDRAANPATVREVMTGELYNVQFNISESYQLISGRNSHSVVSLSAGKALVIGGFMGSTTPLGTTGTGVAATEFFQVP